jgi:hypothetical protein
VLGYRLWIHRGDTPDPSNAARLWDAFQSSTARPPAFSLVGRPSSH